MQLIESIIKHEGFESKPYPDPLTGGAPWTFGHGLTYLTEAESKAVVEMRIASIDKELSKTRTTYNTLPKEAKDIVIEMAYQLGVSGVDRFNKMWSALSFADYERAAEEMLNSKWASQTPSRALNLAGRMRDLANGS